MSFEIKEVQIDSYNDTHNKLINNFVSGLNIICGPNEIGKSTLMAFIKNVFIRKRTDAKGYIKCNFDNDDITLRVEKNKLKDNEQYISKITSHEYNTGFLIDLDDLIKAKTSDSEELVNTIKDSSGNTVNQKQIEYKEYLYDKKKQPFYLTSQNKASKSFAEQFKRLKEIEKNIKEIQKNEDEYNQIFFNIEKLEKEICEKNKQYSYVNFLLQKQKIESNLHSLVVNSKILENRIKFDNIREILGVLNSAKSNIENLESKKSMYEQLYNEKLGNLNKIETFDIDAIKNFRLELEDLKLSKKILDDERQINQQISKLEDELTRYEKNKNDLDIQKKELQNKIIELKINNINEYQQDKELLSGYRENYYKCLSNYTEIENEKKQNSINNPIMTMILFGLILLSSIYGLFMFATSKAIIIFGIFCIISLIGIFKNMKLLSKSKSNFYKENCQSELNEIKKHIKMILLKNGFEFNENEDIVVFSNTMIQIMHKNISNYESISDEILKIDCNIQKIVCDEKNINDELIENKNNLAKILKDKKDLTEKLHIRMLENYDEIYEYIKDIQNLIKELESINSEFDNVEKLKDKFVENVNDFIKKSEIENVPNINKYDNFEDILSSINKILELNLENNRIKQEYSQQLEELNKNVEGFSNEIKNNIENIDETTLINLKSELDELTETRGRLLNQKENLENEFGLINLQNEKMAEINKLKLQMGNLFVKQMVYSVIVKSKDKFNESQPNLVSAKKFLSQITCGKYDEIDIENKCISGKNTPEKKWDELSRGTKEQLYLALRLGYAENFSKNKDGNSNGLPELPLIIDDAFVNFDTLRTQACIECLNEFAKTHQVLYFTCHNDLIENIVQTLGIKCNVIEL